MKNWKVDKILTLLVIAAIIIVTVSPIIATNSVVNAPWPKAGHDNHNTGQSSYSGAQKYIVKWNYTLKCGSIASSPVIGPDGTIYFGNNFKDGKRNYGSLIALSPKGIAKWNKTLNEGYNSSIFNGRDSSPVIGSDGTIYFGGDFSDGKRDYGVFYALNPDRTIKWKYTLKDGINCRIGSSPIIGSDGTVYFGGDFSSDKGDYGVFYALNPNGTLKWKYILKDGIYNFIVFSPVIGSDGTMYFGSGFRNDDGRQLSNFYALNRNGTLKWNYTLDGEPENSIESSPSIGLDGTIYFGSSFGDGESDYTNIYALSRNGSLKWNRTLTEGGYAGISGIAIGSDGIIYVGCNFLNKRFFSMIKAFNSDGTVKWNRKLLNGDDNGLTSPIAIGSDGTLYFGGYCDYKERRFGNFYALNHNGTLKWNSTLKDGISCQIEYSPAIGSDGTVYFVNDISDKRHYSKLYALKGNH